MKGRGFLFGGWKQGSGEQVDGDNQDDDRPKWDVVRGGGVPPGGGGESHGGVDAADLF